MSDDRDREDVTLIGRFYLQLFALPTEPQPARLLDEAIRFLVEDTRAELGYVELRGAGDVVAYGCPAHHLRDCLRAA
jgi:hypothetical protein